MAKIISEPVSSVEYKYTTIGIVVLSVILLHDVPEMLETDEFVMLYVDIAIIVLFILMSRNQLWVLSDKVVDHGDFLEFCRGEKNQKVYLREIKKIKYIIDIFRYVPGNRIVIWTDTPGTLGKKLSFRPIERPKQIYDPSLILELKERINDARYKTR